MTGYSIEELEALKEGTTPGLWAATNPPYSPHNPPEIFDAETASLILRIDPETDHPGYADRNLQLLAASPAVIDQLIATEKELQRVRNGIEELRAECQNVVDEQGSGHEAYTGNEVAENIEVAHVNALTRILEGTNE
ncbi:hypothetical protein phi16_gp086 [Corynebacterium phage phi16]|uniref:hypothetical protein n=1 Tax=Corynebacterium glutamicum TaxID=1718 RepID=UPI00094212A6|nr:hypothetical protein [Corynebacterium glutamicum]APQ42589.1 hypothetical protein phi16_gp086 [Corynebacterium phage phi16]OKX80509.1 hypothetical protein AUO95_10205 [Corynebacterium glutamicum]